MSLSPALARLFDEAQDLHQAGRLADAKARYDRILAEDPRHGPTLHMVGLMAYQVGQNDLAVDILSRAAQHDGASAALHSNLGLALRAQGKVAEAAASFRRALGINPDAAETHSNLGNVLMEQGHVAAAANAYARAVALNPGLAALHANLGDALWAQGKLADAEASHARALALEPGNADTLKSLALLALARGDAGLAMRRIHEAVRRDDSPRTHRIFADIVQGLSWESDDDGVRALLTRAIDEGWSRPSVFAGTALGLVRQRQAGGGRLQDDGLLLALLRAVPNSDVALEPTEATVQRPFY